MWAQQTVASPSLRSLDFLRGIWIGHNNARPAESIEFHWDNRQGAQLLVGRSGFTPDPSCPWCAAQAALVAKYDPTANQVRMHLVDRSEHVMDFHLVYSDGRAAQFVTNVAAGMPTYRLTYRLVKPAVLSSTLEAAKPGRANAFAPIVHASYDRR